MARRPLTAAFGRTIGAMLTAEGFQVDGLRWWQRSALGDFVVVEVQTSLAVPGMENCFVNVAFVPGPRYAWLRWLNPANDYGDGPSAILGVLQDRVQPPGVGWLSLTSKESAAELGAWVVETLADPVLPRLRRCFDRNELLAELAKQPATGDEKTMRAAFRAEAGDVASADEALGPPDEDDENMARYRSWLHEYAAAASRD